VTRRQANAWAKDFECWADCDGLCIHLFRKTPFAHDLAVAWSGRREELVKRAGFTMMATLAVHDKAAGNEVFRSYLGRVLEEATDERHNVKKGVNWALRQIGKRNPILNREAILMAKRIQEKDSPGARWIACDALRELQRWKPR
jgi:3-methyladenine DNA glycosylase AlkD